MFVPTFAEILLLLHRMALFPLQKTAELLPLRLTRSFWGSEVCAVIDNQEQLVLLSI